MLSLESARQGLWDYSVKTGDVIYSERWASMLGYELSEIEPNIRTWKSLLHPEDVSRVTRVMDDHLMKRTPFYETEFRLKNKSGEWTWILSCGKVTERDKNGEPVRMIGTHQNVTERKKLEEQLRHSQKMEALGQLAGGIAHDFNNILTAIISYGYILKTRMDEHDDPLTYCIDAILASSDRAAILTRGLLSFSRKQIIDPKLLGLNNVIKKFEDLLLRVICEDIELNIGLTDEDIYVMADRIQIELVLMNLITNSCDVMPKGGEITIKTERVELDDKFIDMKGYGKTGEYALISVTDTGSGMDDETMSKIFEPFFTTKESGKGTGLGLSIIFGTMKQHDGYVDVESEVGKGTTFRIYFPLVEAKTEEKAFEEGPLIGGTETILIAEDEESVMFPLKMVLKEFGYEVIEAVDGEDAVNKFMENKDRLQLVIIDVVMPRKSGKEVYEEIKKVSSGIKVIFTSGYTSDIIDTKGAIDRGIDFLSKPVSPDELLRKIRKVLDKKG
ncbi:MAG: PAS domain-containing protein [Candidatus Mariimomonas ferrooxydans]